ncbi:hypothetical protein [Algibacter sp. 2305UL17-15]|uniref:hypothetical protein n=1 Tax=Algibacter sp. 2305UL17-15 TaxID=3231268 RepID=UPI00345A77C8
MSFRIILFLLLGSFSLFAQNSTAEVALDKSCVLLNFIDLGENGFIVKTGKEKAAYSKKLKWQVHYFDNDLNLIYSMPIKKDQLDTGSGNPILASRSGDYFYHEEFKITTSFGAGKGHFTQIKKDKNIKTHDVKYKDYKGKSIENSFVDDDYYNMLCVEKEKKSRKNKNPKKTYTLYQFDHAEFNRTEVILDLPQIIEEDDIDKTSWEFSDQKGGFIYMSRKDLNFESDNHTYHVVALNKSDGKIANQFTLNFSIGSKHIRPSNNNIEIFGARYSSLGDFSLKTVGTGTSSRGSFHHRLSAFGKLKLDLDSQKAYVFGLYGDKEFKRIGSTYQGYYIKGYNFNGKKEFEVLKGLPQNLAKESGFKVHNIPHQRILHFNVFKEYFELSINSKKQSYMTRFSNSGEYIKTVNVKPLRKIKDEKPYRVISELISSEDVKGFLETKKPIKRNSKSKINILKRKKGWDILYNILDEKIVFYSFSNE